MKQYKSWKSKSTSMKDTTETKTSTQIEILLISHHPKPEATKIGSLIILMLILANLEMI